MVLLLWVAAGLALLYFWLTGHWFAWIVAGGLSAITVQLWAPIFGLADVKPQSPEMYQRMAVAFACAGIPFYLRMALTHWINRPARDWRRP